MCLAGQPGELALEDQPIILVIEDDQAIQGVIEDALTEGGFEPAIAPSGEEAVTLLKGGQINYRALVTDFPTAYITAAHADQWPSQGVPNSILLTKPFAPAQLVTAVSQLLNTGTPTTEGRLRCANFCQ